MTGRKGRPLKGKESRDAKIVICIEEHLKDALGEMALDSRRSLSDYCHYVLEQHYWAVKQEENNMPVATNGSSEPLITMPEPL